MAQFKQNALGVNAEATFGKLGIFGRYGISLSPETASGNFFAVGGNAQTWMAGGGLSDLIIPGSMLSVAAGQPFITPNNGVPEQTNYEAFY